MYSLKCLYSFSKVLSVGMFYHRRMLWDPFASTSDGNNSDSFNSLQTCVLYENKEVDFYDTGHYSFHEHDDEIYRKYAEQDAVNNIYRESEKVGTSKRASIRSVNPTDAQFSKVRRLSHLDSLVSTLDLISCTDKSSSSVGSREDIFAENLAISGTVVGVDARAFSNGKEFIVNTFIERKDQFDGLICKIIPTKSPKTFKYNKIYSNQSVSLNNMQFTVQKKLGKGGFGHALLCLENKQQRVLKIDYERNSVVWECLMQQLVKERIDVNDSISQKYYESHIVPPRRLFIFDDASVITMDYCNLGTLYKCFCFLTSKNLPYTTFELEYLALIITIQLVEILILLFRVNVQHNDIKLDNLALKKNPNLNSLNDLAFQVVLIDFGLATSSVANSLIDSVVAERIYSKYAQANCVKQKHFNTFTRLKFVRNPSKNLYRFNDKFAVLNCIHCFLFREYKKLQKLEMPKMKRS